jgi:hypothetical protein
VGTVGKGGGVKEFEKAEFSLEVGSIDATGEVASVTIDFCSNEVVSTGEVAPGGVAGDLCTGVTVANHVGDFSRELSGNFVPVGTFNGRIAYQHPESLVFLYWYTHGTGSVWGFGSGLGGSTMYAYFNQNIAPPVNPSVALFIFTAAGWIDDTTTTLSCYHSPPGELPVIIGTDSTTQGGNSSSSSSTSSSTSTAAPAAPTAAPTAAPNGGPKFEMKGEEKGEEEPAETDKPAVNAVNWVLALVAVVMVVGLIAYTILSKPKHSAAQKQRLPGRESIVAIEVGGVGAGEEHRPSATSTAAVRTSSALVVPTFQITDDLRGGKRMGRRSCVANGPDGTPTLMMLPPSNCDWLSVGRAQSDDADADADGANRKMSLMHMTPLEEVKVRPEFAHAAPTEYVEARPRGARGSWFPPMFAGVATHTGIRVDDVTGQLLPSAMSPPPSPAAWNMPTVSEGEGTGLVPYTVGNGIINNSSPQQVVNAGLTNVVVNAGLGKVVSNAGVANMLLITESDEDVGGSNDADVASTALYDPAVGLRVAPAYCAPGPAVVYGRRQGAGAGAGARTTARAAPKAATATATVNCESGGFKRKVKKLAGDGPRQVGQARGTSTVPYARGNNRTASGRRFGVGGAVSKDGEQPVQLVPNSNFDRQAKLNVSRRAQGLAPPAFLPPPPFDDAATPAVCPDSPLPPASTTPTAAELL